MGRDDSPLRDRMIFLVGARRSGTNWLQRTLTAHPSVAGMPSETHLFTKGLTPLTERFQHTNPGSLMMGMTYVERDNLLDGLRDLADRAFADNLARIDPDARYLAERTPWHVYDLELIAQVYPDARVIHIVRDGRAVARSLMAMSWGPATMEEAAEEWRSSVESGRRGAELFGDRYFEVRYETMLADPRTGIERLFSWLDLPLDGGVLDRLLAEAGSEFNVDPSKPGIRADKWKDGLSAADLATFERVAGHLLEPLGYEHESLARPSRAAALGARVRSAASSARHLRSTVRAAREGRRAKDALRTLHVNYETVERFQQAVSQGRLGIARQMLAPNLKLRLALDGESSDLRGPEAIDALLEELTRHDGEGGRALSGTVHSSPTASTLVTVYESGDGRRWSRTLVLVLADGVINDATLYRFQVAAAPAVA